MAKFERKYTDAQRQAVYRLVYEDGLSAPDAVAQAGHGVYGLEPFEMPATTAREYARRIKRQREGLELTPLARKDPSEALKLLARRSIALLDREFESLEKASRKGNIDLDRLVKASRVRRELEGSVKHRPLEKPVDDEADKSASAEVARIIRRHRETLPPGGGYST